MARQDSTPHRVALYARISTKNNGQNPLTQLMPLRDYAKARGFDHRFGNEGILAGRNGFLRVSLSIRSTSDAGVGRVVNGAFFGFGRA